MSLLGQEKPIIFLCSRGNNRQPLGSELRQAAKGWKEEQQSKIHMTLGLTTHPSLDKMLDSTTEDELTRNEDEVMGRFVLYQKPMEDMEDELLERVSLG